MLTVFTTREMLTSMRPHLAQRPASRAVAQHHSRIAPLRLPVASASLPKDASDGWLDLTRLVTGGGGSKSPYDDLAAEIGKQASQGRDGELGESRQIIPCSGPF